MSSGSSARRAGVRSRGGGLTPACFVRVVASQPVDGGVAPLALGLIRGGGGGLFARDAEEREREREEERHGPHEEEPAVAVATARTRKGETAIGRPKTRVVGPASARPGWAVVVPEAPQKRRSQSEPKNQVTMWFRRATRKEFWASPEWRRASFWLVGSRGLSVRADEGFKAEGGAGGCGGIAHFELGQRLAAGQPLAPAGQAGRGSGLATCEGAA